MEIRFFSVQLRIGLLFRAGQEGKPATRSRCKAFVLLWSRCVNNKSNLHYYNLEIHLCFGHTRRAVCAHCVIVTSLWPWVCDLLRALV